MDSTGFVRCPSDQSMTVVVFVPVSIIVAPIPTVPTIMIPVAVVGKSSWVARESIDDARWGNDWRPDDHQRRIANRRGRHKDRS